MRALVVVLALCATASADPAAIKKLLEDQRQQLHIAGLSYAVIVDDKVIAIEGLGQRDITAKQPVTPDTVFPIGSCTKVEWNAALPTTTFAKVGKLPTTTFAKAGKLVP
jgi:CubicO group peptidase (beta-lactamase class C family)